MLAISDFKSKLFFTHHIISGTGTRQLQWMAGNFSTPTHSSSTENSDQTKDLWNLYQEWVKHTILYFSFFSNSCACCPIYFNSVKKIYFFFFHLDVATVTSRQLSSISNPQDLCPLQSICFYFKDCTALMTKSLFSKSDLPWRFPSPVKLLYVFFIHWSKSTLERKLFFLRL